MNLEEINAAIASTQSQIDAIGEIARQDSIRTSTAKRFTPNNGAIEAQARLPSLNSQLEELQAAKNRFLIQETSTSKTSSQMQVSTPMIQKDTRQQIIQNTIVEKKSNNMILIALAFIAVIIFGVMK